ncbi:hypothetical protein GCM10023238_26240 [Streptomyces heliomycini]
MDAALEEADRIPDPYRRSAPTEFDPTSVLQVAPTDLLRRRGGRRLKVPRWSPVAALAGVRGRCSGMSCERLGP